MLMHTHALVHMHVHVYMQVCAHSCMPIYQCTHTRAYAHLSYTARGVRTCAHPPAHVRMCAHTHTRSHPRTLSTPSLSLGCPSPQE